MEKKLKKSKPIVYAICGKSASGKDTIAKQIENYYLARGEDAKVVKNITTRPPRKGEINAYNSRLTIEDENTSSLGTFRGWSYAIPRDAFCHDINICVINAKTFKNVVEELEKDFVVKTIYLDVPFLTRLKRSVLREKKIRPEFFRRAFVDWLDFRTLKKDVKFYVTIS